MALCLCSCPWHTKERVTFFPGEKKNRNSTNDRNTYKKHAIYDSISKIYFGHMSFECSTNKSVKQRHNPTSRIFICRIFYGNSLNFFSYLWHLNQAIRSFFSSSFRAIDFSHWTRFSYCFLSIGKCIHISNRQCDSNNFVECKLMYF